MGRFSAFADFTTIVVSCKSMSAVQITDDRLTPTATALISFAGLADTFIQTTIPAAVDGLARVGIAVAATGGAFGSRFTTDKADRTSIQFITDLPNKVATQIWTFFLFGALTDFAAVVVSGKAVLAK